MTTFFLRNFSILVFILLISACKKDEPATVAPVVPIVLVDPVVNTGLISNGDFRGALTGWMTKTVRTGTVTAVKDSSNSCMKLTHKLANDWCAIGQEIRSKLTAGKSYTVSFRYKVLDGKSVYLGIAWGDATLWGAKVPVKEATTALVLDGKWHTISQFFTCSTNFPTSSFPQIGIYFDYNFSEAGANILIDDYILTESKGK